MDGKFDLLTIISLAVAVFAIFKLRSVLGRKSTDDEARAQQRLRAAREAQERAGADKVVTLPRRDRPAPGQPAAGPDVALAEVEARLRTFAGANAGLAHGLMDIFRADRSFNPEHFMVGAKQAYEMIVTAFGEGNRKVLKDLLARDVFDGFSEAIADRESRGEQIDQSFVGISKAEMVEAELKQSQAQVTVKFESQLISATRDRSGQVIAGDPQRITDVTDIWTFARDVASRNPNWRLIATQVST
jgi:predicted lipid-binding transport protein (Tim44 family)